MVQNEIRLSIIIPFYNPGELLGICLKSILKEIPINAEILLIDDGSTQKYNIQNDNKIRLLKNDENMGVSFSRNLGVKEAKGDYIMFVDADDIMKEGWGHHIDEIETNEDIIYYSKNKLVDNRDTILKQILGINGDGIYLAGPFSKLYKRKFIERNKLRFKEDLINGEDMLFNVEALLASKQIKVVNEGIYLYRNNYNSSTKSFNEKIIKNDMIFSKYLQSILPKKHYKLTHLLGINGLYIVLERIANLSHAKAMQKYGEIQKDFYLKFKDEIGTLDLQKRMAIRAFMKNQFTLSYCIIRIRKIASKISKKKVIFTEI